MAKATRSAPVCHDCGRQIDRPKRGRPAKRCADCKAAVGRVSYSESLTCPCGASFERVKPSGRRPIYCGPCRALARRKANQKFEQRRTLARVPKPLIPKPIRVKPTRECLDCDAPVTLGPKGGRAFRCASCRDTRAERQVRAEYEKRYGEVKRIREALNSGNVRSVPCEGCGAELESKPVGKFRRWCTKCTPAHRREISAAWRAANPDAWRRSARNADRRRRAAKMGVGSQPYLSEDIFERDGWKCLLCRRRINRKLKWPHPGSPSIDHTIPLSRGGVDAPVNVTAAHLRCNWVKNNRGGGEQLALIG